MWVTDVDKMKNQEVLNAGLCQQVYFQNALHEYCCMLFTEGSALFFLHVRWSFSLCISSSTDGTGGANN